MAEVGSREWAIEMLATHQVPLGFLRSHVTCWHIPMVAIGNGDEQHV